MIKAFKFTIGICLGLFTFYVIYLAALWGLAYWLIQT